MNTSSSKTDGNPVYFWKPEEQNGYLGQWYPSSFTWNSGDTIYSYANAEQYMMHRKALLFAGPDHLITKEIQNGWKVHPRKLRELGRKIPGFLDEVWERERYAIVLEGNRLKFAQNSGLKEQLLATGDRELVEASPSDRIWGIGFGAANAETKRTDWGLNLLGKALMETRHGLKEADALK